MNHTTDNIKSTGRETEISKVMNDLFKAVECLAQSVEAMEVKLSGVIRSSKPSESTGVPLSNSQVEDTIYETNLAQGIDKVHNKIQSLRERLDDLLNRIEI